MFVQNCALSETSSPVRYSSFMNRNRLVRTPIVDKNGKPTTVHKRTGSGSDKTDQALPAPELKPKRDPAQAYVEDAFTPCVDRLPPVERQKLMATLHPETLPRMVDMKRRHPNMIMFAIKTAIDLSADNGDFAVFNSLILLGHSADESESQWYRDAVFALTGIEYINDSPSPIDFTQEEDPRLEGARPLFDTLMKGNYNNDLIEYQTLPNHQGVFIFHHPDVGRLVMARPDKAEEIVDLYFERKEYDPELFASVLNSTSSPAINDGIL